MVDLRHVQGCPAHRAMSVLLGKSGLRVHDPSDPWWQRTTCENPAVEAGWTDAARQAWSLVTYIGGQESGLLGWGVCWGQDSVLPGAVPWACRLFPWGRLDPRPSHFPSSGTP